MIMPVVGAVECLEFLWVRNHQGSHNPRVVTAATPTEKESSLFPSSPLIYLTHALLLLVVVVVVVVSLKRNVSVCARY